MSPKKVLLVDDHRDSADVFRSMLEHHGYRVFVCSDGEECLAVAAAELPDLILMDFWLPRLDGWSAVRRLKLDAATREIPIVAVTANVQDEVQQAALAAGCVAFLRKPLSPSRLVSEVRGLIG